MKKIISVVLICCCLVAMHTTALAAGGITVTASSSKAEAGDSITVSGTATPDTWISIEGTDADGNILYFSAALSDATGAYSVTFKAPEMDDGTLTLTAGNGSMTASTTVKIYTASSDDSDEDADESTDDSSTDASATASAQASQTVEASETPNSAVSEASIASPVASDEASDDAVQTGDTANSQFPVGIPVWILICVFALILIAGVILFLRNRKRM
jgi:hypothetical protein